MGCVLLLHRESHPYHSGGEGDSLEGDPDAWLHPIPVPSPCSSLQTPPLPWCLGFPLEDASGKNLRLGSKLLNELLLRSWPSFPLSRATSVANRYLSMRQLPLMGLGCLGLVLGGILVPERTSWPVRGVCHECRKHQAATPTLDSEPCCPQPPGDPDAALPDSWRGWCGAAPGPRFLRPRPPPHWPRPLPSLLSLCRLFRTESLEHLLTPRSCGTAPQGHSWPCPLSPQAPRTSPSTTYSKVSALGMGQLEVPSSTRPKSAPASTLRSHQAPLQIPNPSRLPRFPTQVILQGVLFPPTLTACVSFLQALVLWAGSVP